MSFVLLPDTDCGKHESFSSYNNLFYHTSGANGYVIIYINLYLLWDPIDKMLFFQQYLKKNKITDLVGNTSLLQGLQVIIGLMNTLI